MKDNDFLIEFGSLKARIDNVEEQLRKLPTRPELEVFTQALTNLAEIQKDQSDAIKTFNNYVNRWKGAAFVLMAFGAVLSQLMELVSSYWSNHHTGP